MALCFNCGELKFGAICRCPVCQVESTGNINLDIVFSDHHYSAGTLEEFGGVIKAIHGVTDDPQERFWAFLQYVSENHPSILKIELPDGMPEPVAKILNVIDVPPIMLKPGKHSV